jgi:hypothetical protein
MSSIRLRKKRLPVGALDVALDASVGTVPTLALWCFTHKCSYGTNRWVSRVTYRSPFFPEILEAPKSGRGVLDFTYTFALCFTTIVI